MSAFSCNCNASTVRSRSRRRESSSPLAQGEHVGADLETLFIGFCRFMYQILHHMYRVLYDTDILLIMALINNYGYYESRGTIEGVLRDAVTTLCNGDERPKGGPERKRGGEA